MSESGNMILFKSYHGIEFSAVWNFDGLLSSMDLVIKEKNLVMVAVTGYRSTQLCL